MKLKNKLFISALMIGLGVTGYAKTGDKVEISAPFEAKVVTDGLEAPWAMSVAPDGNLWITEREGKHIAKINPETGEYKRLYTVENAFVGPQHEGVLGLAFGPNFMSKKGNAKNEIYFAYTYKDKEGKEFARISRLTYDLKSDNLKDEKVILDKLPASNDHNSGRLVLGPDNKLYYTIGDQGGNQGANKDKPILSQILPTKEEVAKKDYKNYPGSTLRINLDGSIPKDNPVINGVVSHVYTYGHRNAQGLAFVGKNLYSNEHGPSSDDEINLLVPGGNYGWPNIAGYQDDQAYEYVNNSEGGKVYKETEFKAENLQDPVKTFFTVRKNHSFKDEAYGNLNYIGWPTIAPSSLAYYPKDGKIAAFRNSLLVSSLKNGALYIVRLNSDGTQAQGDVSKMFKTNNRYRMVVVSPDTSKLYIATDKSGNVMGVDGLPTSELQNKGAIIEVEYKK